MSDKETTLELTHEQREFAAELIAGVMDDVQSMIEAAIAPLKDAIQELRAEIEDLRAEIDGERND